MDNPLPAPEKTSWVRAAAPPVVILALIAVASHYWHQSRSRLLRPSLTAIYRQTGASWQRMTVPQGIPRELRVSPKGVVWVQVYTPKGDYFAVVEGNGWRVYDGKDFGPQAGYLWGSFVLDGEDVWVDTKGGMLQFHEGAWKLHRETHVAAFSSLAAGGGQVWVLEPKGTIQHFDGSRWTTQQADLPGVKWQGEDMEDAPALALTADGTPWIVKQGVWRLRGEKWEPILSQTDAGAASLVGTAGDGIWLWETERLRSVGTGGKVAVYTSEQTHLGATEWIQEASAAGSRTLFTTRHGILEFDGSTFRPLPRPRSATSGVASVRLGPDGQIWAMGYTPNPEWRYLRYLQYGIPVAVLVSVIGMPIWLVRRWNRFRLKEHRQIRRAVEHATGSPSAELEQAVQRLEKKSSWWSASATIGTIALALIGFTALRRYWRAAPAWMFLVIALAVHAATLLRQSLVRRKPKPWDPIEPGPPRFDWTETRRAVPGSLLVFLLLNFDVWKRVGDPFPLILIGFGIMMAFEMVHQFVVIGAIRRGDYDGALKKAAWFQFYRAGSGDVLRQRGLVLLIAGRYKDAEAMLRLALTKLRAGPEQGHTLDALGDALLEEGRPAEAIRSYEAALHARPGYRRPYRGMAEIVLREGTNPQRALEYVEAIDGGQSAWSRRSINGNPKDDYWSLKAWALAQLGRSTEVGPAIEQAIRHTKKNCKPDLAATYRRAGLALQAIGRETEGTEYLKRARDIDPHGRWGKVAKAELGERSVFRV